MFTDFPGDALKAIEARMRLKAKACRFTPITAMGSAGQNGKTKTALIQEAKDGSTNLWMCRQQFVLPDDAQLMFLLADCFETTAASVCLLLDTVATPRTNVGIVGECLDLVATSQAYLREVVSLVHDNRDNDQYELFVILRDIAQQLRYYLKLKCDGGEPPSSEDVYALREQIDKMQEWFTLCRCQSEQLEALRTQVDAKPQTIAQWMVVSKQVNRLVCNGMSHSNALLRQILLPAFDSIPAYGGYDQNFEIVINEIDKYLATRPELDDSLSQEEPTIEVSKVRSLLEGRKLLLIGGMARSAAKLKLTKSFGLEDLIWVATKPHESVYHFESKVHRSGVAAVLLAIRFASHAFGDIKLFCDEAGVPFVRLPAGYGSNQVARQILAQCGDRLEKQRNSA